MQLNDTQTLSFEIKARSSLICLSCRSRSSLQFTFLTCLFPFIHTVLICSALFFMASAQLVQTHSDSVQWRPSVSPVHWPWTYVDDVVSILMISFKIKALFSFWSFYEEISFGLGLVCLYFGLLCLGLFGLFSRDCFVRLTKLRFKRSLIQ